jgi:hypothetical protein
MTLQTPGDVRALSPGVPPIVLKYFNENLQLRCDNSKLNVELRNREKEITESRKTIGTISDDSRFWEQSARKLEIENQNLTGDRPIKLNGET